jgi:undecaprenyl-diphosphatase
MNFNLVSLLLKSAQSNKLLGFFTKFFSYEAIYVSIIGVPLFLIYRSVNKMNMIAYIVVSLLGTWFFGETLKHIFRLMRPYQAHEIVPLFTEAGYSFPSLHASFAGALIAFAFIFRFPGWQIIIVVGICIGLSRIFGGVHYATDVLAGFILGGAISYGVFLFFTHYQLSLL